MIKEALPNAAELPFQQLIFVAARSNVLILDFILCFQS
jgi:hypothetical protein